MEERLITLLESVLGKGKKTSGNNYAFFSPFAEHYKPKLEINIELNSKGSNVWHCWISEEKGQSIRSLFKKLKVSNDIWEEHNLIFSRKYKYINNQSNNQEETKKVVQLPTEYIPLWKPSNSVIRKHALNYLDGRGISASEIIKYEIGYCEEGIYKHKIIVPSYDSNGRLNYFIGRSFYDTLHKHKNPDVSKDVIGFEMFINWDLPIVICEGVYDAIAIRQNAIPLFGKSIQSNLQKQIISKGVESVYIVLDSDAFKNALTFSENLMNEGIRVYLVELGDLDPSELGFDEINKKIKNTEPLTLLKLMQYKLIGV
jgi:DNA primase